MLLASTPRLMIIYVGLGPARAFDFTTIAMDVVPWTTGSPAEGASMYCAKVVFRFACTNFLPFRMSGSESFRALESWFLKRVHIIWYLQGPGTAWILTMCLRHSIRHSLAISFKHSGRSLETSQCNQAVSVFADVCIPQVPEA